MSWATEWANRGRDIAAGQDQPTIDVTRNFDEPDPAPAAATWATEFTTAPIIDPAESLGGREPPTLPTDRLATFREHAGYGGNPVSIEQAIGSGDLGRYIEYLRQQARAMEPNSAEQRELTARISDFRGEEVEFQRLQREAQRRGVSINTVQMLESPQAEAELALTEPFGTVAGAGLRRAAQGFEESAQSLLSYIGRSTGLFDPRAIARDKALAEQFQTALDRETGLNDVLGDTGAEVFAGVAKSVPKIITVGRLGGTPAVYSVVGAERFDNALNEADAGGLTGFSRTGYAATMAGIELATMFGMGRLGQRLGVTTLEESVSPGMRRLASELFTRAGVRNAVQSAYRGLGGSALEGIEEGAINAMNQALELVAGFRPDFDNESFFTNVTAGFAGGVGVKGLQTAAEAVNRIQERIATAQEGDEIADAVSGVKAAEEGVEAATTAGETPEQMVGESQSGVAKPDESGDTEPESAPASVREALAAAEARTTEPGAAGRGARQARRFFERADRETLLGAMRPMGRAEFREVTGIPNTSGPFRRSFMETLQLYEPVLRRTTVEPDPALPARPETEAGEVEPTTEPIAGTATTPEVSGAAPGVDPSRPADSMEPPSRTRQQQRLETIDNTLAVNQQRVQDFVDNRDQRSVPDTIAEGVRLIQEVLPEGPSRDNLVRQATKIRGPRSFEKLIEGLNKQLTAADHQAARAEFSQALRQAKNLRTEFAGLVEDASGGIDLGDPGSRAGLQVLSEYYRGQPDMPVPLEDQRAIERLQKVPISEMTADEIRGAARAINAAAYQNEVQDKMLATGQQTFVSETSNAIVEESANTRPLRMTTAPGGPGGMVPVGLRQQGEERRRLVSPDSPVVREFAARPEDLWRFSPTLRKLLWEDTFIQPDAKYKGAKRDQLVGLNNVFIRNQLPAGGHSVNGVRVESSPLEDWRMERQQIGQAEITRDEALLIHLMFKDRELASDMREFGANFGVGGRRIRRTGPITPDVEAQVAAFVGNEGLDIADHMFMQLNGAIIDPVNAAWELVNGFPLTTRTQHVPRPTAFDVHDPQQEQQALGFDQRVVEAAVDSYGHLKKREGARGPIQVPRTDTGAIDYFVNHADRMARVAHYLAPYRNAKTVLAQPEVRDAIERVGGETLYKLTLDRIERQVVPVKPKETFERAFTGALGNLKAAKIATSPTAHLLPIVGLMTSAAQQDGGMRRLPGAMAKAMSPSQRRRAHELILRHSPAAFFRYKSGDYVGEVTGGLLSNRSFFRPKPLVDSLSSGVQKAEFALGAAARWFMAEDFVKSQGITPDDPSYNDQVAREWERLLYRGENSSEPMEYNSALAYAHDHATFAPFVAYMNAASKMYSAGLHGLDLVNEASVSTNTGEKARKYAAGGAILAAVGAGIISEGMLRELFSFEEVPGDYTERVAKRSAVGTVTLLPVFGTALERMLRPMLDMRNYPADGDLISSSMTEIADSTASLSAEVGRQGRTAEEQDKYWRNWWRLATVFEFAGIPVSGINQWRRRLNEGVLPGLDRPRTTK